ncbi:MAG: hypothetical protein HFJ35_00525 [Clostridia bacterium]|nr:hypothetical protein [Clostridia bacterium]
MELAGKVLVKLAEMKHNGYIQTDKFIVVPRLVKDENETYHDAVEIYRIENQLSKEEEIAIHCNPRKGIEKAKEKFRQSGPVTISADNIYIDDTIIIQTKEGNTVLIGEIEE